MASEIYKRGKVLPRVTIIRSLIWLVLALFLSAGWQGGCTDDTLFRAKPALIADAGQLSASFVTADLETTVHAGTNLLWCATFQLAWNQACSTLGGDLHLPAPEDPMVAALNHRSVNDADLDPDSYVAAAGRVRDRIYQRIDRLMVEKFHGTAESTLLQRRDLSLRPQDVVAYCYLFKKLDFPIPFERLDTPLDFGGSKVAAFGMGFGKPGHEQMARGVSIIDYKTPDDFVIELKTQSPRDHLILAKITPARTLSDTIAAVQRRRELASPAPAKPIDLLSVPKLNFDVSREYQEILGKKLTAPPAAVTDDLQFLQADQHIRFLMDEKGVELKSEAKMSLGCSVDMVRPPVHQLIFDKPFLLLIIREDSKVPYLAIWVDNAELLEKADR